MTSIKGNNILITGASSGLGKQLALDCAKEGGIPILLARNESKLIETQNKIKSIISPEESNKIKYYVCDITNETQVKNTINNIIKENNKIDIIINCAGYAIFKSFENTTNKEVRELMETNLYGTLNIIRQVLPYLKKENKGHIVNISSVCGLNAFPDMSAYSMSKFAVTGITQALYYELKPQNIEVSLICPGAFNSNIFNHSSFKDVELKTRNLMSVENISKKCIKSIKKNKFETIIPFRSKILNIASRIIGNIYRKRILKNN